jgi:hypothetical protein
MWWLDGVAAVVRSELLLIGRASGDQIATTHGLGPLPAERGAAGESPGSGPSAAASSVH